MLQAIFGMVRSGVSVPKVASLELFVSSDSTTLLAASAETLILCPPAAAVQSKATVAVPPALITAISFAIKRLSSM